MAAARAGQGAPSSFRMLRVSTEFNDRFRAVAERDGLQMNELLEKALDAYERGRP